MVEKRKPNIAVMTGNEACAAGALAAGMRFFAGYPITPSSEIAEVLSAELPRLGGKFMQMEDEISAMGAIIGASLTGMHHQFEVWRNAIDCHQSLRSMDVASLRRAVETFAHYVVEQPGLVLWLEIARAHLSLCLGKPQEALVTYTKWLDRIGPGQDLAWDTLYYGYADALINAGEASRALRWLEQTLLHPVLSDATDTTSRATLVAQLAWAEAECKALDDAKQRIQALARELADSGADHPLVLGFIHEVAARVAQRAGDEKLLAAHLGDMKRWYAQTRNQAAMMRGQRVQDGLCEVRTNPRLLDPDRDRNVVTKVTTRRDNSGE